MDSIVGGWSVSPFDTSDDSSENNNLVFTAMAVTNAAPEPVLYLGEHYIELKWFIKMI